MMKLAIVGTGKIVKDLLPGVLDWGWSVCALCGTKRSEAELRRMQQEYHIPRGYTDYAEMLNETDADAIYLGTPNHLHFEMARQALEMGKNVIVEKPLTSNACEAETLAKLSKERGLFLFEAMSSLYMPVFRQTERWLSQIGEVKLVDCNFSQYSSRYDAFCRGEILPVFDPAKSGGALMDLNVYNLHYVVGLFGLPKQIRYDANIQRGIDTSGVLGMGYPGFQAVCVAAKDCAAPNTALIQGTKGYIRMDAAGNCCGSIELRRNDGSVEVYDVRPKHRMEPEFRFFSAAIQNGDWMACCEKLDRSVEIMRLMTDARLGAGIRFAADEP